MIAAILRLSAAVAAFLALAISSNAQTSYCIEQHAKGDTAIGIDASDARHLIDDVAKSIGLQASVVVIPCRYVEKAVSVEVDGSTPGRPAGQYVVYNPDWVREVIGSDRIQAIALFGHEFGHLLNQHFTHRRNIPRIQMETEADGFAGCAVARLGGSWEALSGLLSRLRRADSRDRDYPDRLVSLEVAQRGFLDCGGSQKQPETCAGVDISAPPGSAPADAAWCGGPGARRTTRMQARFDPTPSCIFYAAKPYADLYQNDLYREAVRLAKVGDFDAAFERIDACQCHNFRAQALIREGRQRLVCFLRAQPG